MDTELPSLDPDDQFTPEVGDWSEVKYRHVQHYARMFSTSMKNKWPVRVYIDLFAGAGRSTMRDSRKIVEASPLIALNVEDSFNKYFFCEQDATRLAALKSRTQRHPHASRITFVEGDINQCYSTILSQIIEPKKALCFCFADPFSLENLKFSTIKNLASQNIDFLILIPSFMDANRNPKYYMPTDNRTVEDFLGEPEWREKWSQCQCRDSNSRFGVFVLDRYKANMASLGFKCENLPDLVEVRTQRNIPLYHLAFFSRHELALKFWKSAKMSSDHQRRLF